MRLLLVVLAVAVGACGAKAGGEGGGSSEDLRRGETGLDQRASHLDVDAWAGGIPDATGEVGTHPHDGLEVAPEGEHWETGGDIGGEEVEPGLDVAADLVPAWECAGVEVEYPPCDPDGPTVTVTGNVVIFGPPWGYVEYAPVTIVEMPGKVAMTDDYGDFEFTALPPCQDATFRVEQEGFVTTYTETFRTGTEPLDQVAFQAPTVELFELIATTIGGIPGPDKCNIGGTVSVKEMSLDNYLVPHGVDGTEVTLCPYPGEGHGPIYFEYITDALILPDISLTQSTVDGGYIFKGLEPGDYVLRAYKEEVEFRTVRVRCEAGRFINAAPPMGLHELDS